MAGNAKWYVIHTYSGYENKVAATIEKAVELLAYNPRNRFNIDSECDFTVWDLNTEFTVNPDEFLSQGKATPFEGTKLFGRCIATVHNGKIVYKG